MAEHAREEKEPRFDRLVALLPELESRAGSGMFFDQWGSPPSVDRLAGDIYEIAHEDNAALLPFDWASWKEGERYFSEPAEIDSSDLQTCRKVLTVCVRQERFVEGSLSGRIESGLVARLVRRIGVLAQRLPPEGMIDVATDLLAEEEQREQLEQLRALLGGQLSSVRLLVQELLNARNPEQRKVALDALPTCLMQLELAANRLLERLSLDPLEKEPDDG